MGKFTNKQKAFVEHYCGDCKLNGHKAAVAAGYSEKTALAIGSENLSKPSIKEAIVKRMAKKQEKYEWNEQIALQELKEAAAQADTLRLPGVRVSAAVARNRMFGMDKDAGGSTGDIPKPLSDDDLEALKAIAKAVTERELAKPKLHKEAV